MLTDDDIARIERVLRAAATGAGEAREAVAAGWRRDAAAINRIMAIYGKGEPPRYPRIDAMSLDPASPDFAMMLTLLPDAFGRNDATAIDRSLDVALGLLDLNGRDEAVRYGAAENAGALAAAQRVDWSAHPYTAIIVPGAGPEDTLVTLSAAAKLRLALAADHYHRGDAPFVIVSGGNVHPARTPVNEAVEMRRALVGRFGVPADRVVLEPFARHTTTNLRNAARLLSALGAPERDALIVTDPRQSGYIESAAFARRTLDELGYAPGRISARLSDTALRFLPSAASLVVDPLDPLDP